MRNYTVVIGYGTRGRSAIAAFLVDGVDPVEIAIIDTDKEVFDYVSDQGLTAAHGSTAKSDVLRLAGIQRVRSIVTVPNKDSTAVLATLSARELAPDASIVASVRESESHHLLTQSDADQVVISSETAGRILGLVMMTPLVMEMIGDPLSPDEGLSAAERLVTEEKIGASPRYFTGVALGVVRFGELYRIDPPKCESVEPGDRLLYVRRAYNNDE